MRFIDIHHESFNGPDGNNLLGYSFSFIHDLYLHIVALNMTFNKKTHGSEYNAESLEDRLMADYHFDFPKNSMTVTSDTNNAATKGFEYFYEDSEQVNCEMHHLNSAIKYGFVILENTRSTSTVDENRIWIKLSNSKCKRVSDTFTPGGTFPEGKELI